MSLFICAVKLDYEGMVTGFAIFAKALATCTYTIVFIYASELFPTEVRNSAMGTAMMAASFGSIISPYFGAPMASNLVIDFFAKFHVTDLLQKRFDCYQSQSLPD
jgi:MFS family permease